MKYINEEKIESTLLSARKASAGTVRKILQKSRALKRLTLREAAVLLETKDPVLVDEIYSSAAYVKDKVYGNRVVLFVPLYMSNFCANDCVYCAFRKSNTALRRKALSPDEIQQEIRWLLTRGHKRVLLVAGEALSGKHGVEYYAQAIRAIYSVNVGPHSIRRVNINCAPLEVKDFKVLKEAGIGTYQLFQETYHDATYRAVHPSGPKSDPDYRIGAIDRAMKAGIDDVGLGVLYGLYDYRFETLALLSHVEHLEKRFKVGPHTLSVPRIEPAFGGGFSENPPHRVSDEDFKKLVAILRLAVPYTGIILSTRESGAMRDTLVGLGVSQISAESKTTPGGYGRVRSDDAAQFTLSDERSIDEVVGSLIEKGYMPSFCAACYRTERTGEAFMKLARPGTIKGKCGTNALITLKEYLDDFASNKTKRAGYAMIADAMATLDTASKEKIAFFFTEIDKGVRDEYV